MRKPKELTNGSTFSEMIEKNYLYIDKTQHIYQLFNGGLKYYFLSRPRRFGKSLLISTLKELFSGNKKLFEELWIGKSELSRHSLGDVGWGWAQHPVIQLDFSEIAHETSVELKTSLNSTLDDIAAANNISVESKHTIPDKFKRIVTELAKKEKVVILIDEYDKPIIDHVTNLEIAEKNRTVLKSFYDVLKAQDKNLRAVFVTGVSKFSKTSIFSGLNNLNDISHDSIAASLLGYTQQELESYLTSYVTEVAKVHAKSIREILDEMKQWYNGYRFSKDEVCVYNPFSVLYYLTKKERKNYWFDSGTPTFLMKLLKKSQEALKDFSEPEVTEAELGPFELEDIPVIPLLYQTGYLTIADSFKKGNTDMYRLRHPNAEVRESFSRCILITLTHLSDAHVVKIVDAIKDALISNNIAKVCQHMRILFANIPAKLHIEREHYYHSLFLLTFNLMGLEFKIEGQEDKDLQNDAEVPTSKGFIDMVVKTTNRIFLLEFKFNKPAKTAINQIHRKEYYQKYLGQGLPITLAGISFIYKEKKLDITFVQEILD
jgi:hypothetical protein